MENNCILPGLKNLGKYRLQLKLISPSLNNQRDGRFVMVGLGSDPFKLNNIYTREAYPTRESVLDFNYNRIVFRPPKTQKGTYFLEDFPKTVIENPINILLEGETGTGKTRLAKDIHNESKVCGKFVHLNLAACSSGLIESELFGHVKGAFTGAIKNRIGAFEEAHNGTLFLDEIDSLSLELQTKLLLVLESMCVRPVGSDRTRKVKMRIIFASGRSLIGLVRKRLFREDFYYRVDRGYYRKLLPLREAPHVLEALLDEFLAKNNLTCSPNLLNYYKTLRWPGNIRQFLGHLEKKLILVKGGYFDFDREDELLGRNNAIHIDHDREIIPLREMSRLYVRKVLAQMGDRHKETANLLKISKGTLKRLLTESEIAS